MAPDDGNVFPEGALIDLDWSGGGSGVEYFTEVAGGPTGSGSFGPQGASFQELGPLPAGYDYTWRVRARGPGGDGPWSEVRDFSVRLATPTDLAASALSCTEMALTWRDNSASEDGYLVYRDGTLIGQTNSGETTFVARDLAGGATHPFTVRARRGDHESAASDVTSLATPPCDTTAPTGGWLAPAANVTIRQAVVPLEADAADAGSGVDHVNFRGRWGGTWQDVATLTSPPYRVAWDLCQAGVPDGPVDLRVRIVDRVGNETQQTIGVVKRANCAANTPPETPRITSPNPGARAVAQIPIAIVASDAYDTAQELQVEVRIDDGPWTGAAFNTQSGRYVVSWDTTGIADGPHDLLARATDSGGITTRSDTVFVIVDNVDAPLVADAGPDRTVVDGDDSGAEEVVLDAKASAHDPQRTATYAWEDRWDGRPPVMLGSSKQITADLGLGTHVVRMTLTDSLGNQDDDETIITVIPAPDTIAPTAVWSVPAAGAIVQERTITLGANVTDTGGSGLKEVVFRARWGGAWHTIATIRQPHSPIGYRWDVCGDGVPDGGIELGLRATDNAGNQFDAPVRTVSKRFRCVPILDLSPPNGARGEAVQLTASGFAAGETVTASLVQEQKTQKNKSGKKGRKGKRGKRRQQPQQVTKLSTASVTAQGTASMTFTVPKDAPLGRHRLDLVGSEGTRASTTFTVLSGQPRTAAAGRASNPDDAADASEGMASDTPDQSPPATSGPDQALLPSESGTLAASPSKRKPGKNHDRANRGDDNKKEKQKAQHKKKQARIDDRRHKRHRSRRAGKTARRQG
jgi:hypothetical protein